MSESNKPSCPYPKCGCVGYGYVPVQEMEEVYDDCTGLMQGTIFPELLKKIQCSNFAAYDMLLYLDTHSDDKKAFRMFQALVKKTKELKCEYEEKFGPLNQFSTAMQDEFNWLDNPWPWEKEANK